MEIADRVSLLIRCFAIFTKAKSKAFKVQKSIFAFKLCSFGFSVVCKSLVFV